MIKSTHKTAKIEKKRKAHLWLYKFTKEKQTQQLFFSSVLLVFLCLADISFGMVTFKKRQIRMQAAGIFWHLKYYQT